MNDYYKTLNFIAMAFYLLGVAFCLPLVGTDLTKVTSIEPRNVSYSITEQYCDTKIFIENSGCETCFGITYSRKQKRPTWINNINGCSYEYKGSNYSFNFKIAQTFDANSVIEEVLFKLEQNHCK